MDAPSASNLIHFPEPSPADEPHTTMWGFADTAFVVEADHIVLQSPRYENAGRPLSNFAPFVEKAVGIPFDPKDRHEPRLPHVPQVRECSELFDQIKAVVGAEHCTLEDGVRLRHGHGHHLEEIYLVLFDRLERVPDIVVFPKDAEEVQAVLRLARQHRALVVPFGGGTSVTMALSCKEEERVVVSLDLKRMNRILWLDPESRTACVEAGAVGSSLERQLREVGYTLGHEPDSIELSTLGGWIATHASGMKKNRYGNIEDIVLDLTLVSEEGKVHHLCAVPRASHGIDVRRLAFGSEGLLGIITQATVRVVEVPKTQRYGSLVFPTWQAGLSFMRALSARQAVPASVRLVDNLQFQFGRALKPVAGRGFATFLQKMYLTRVKGFDLSQMVAATLVYEGDEAEQRSMVEQVEATAREYGGLSAGSSAGKDGYNLTFGIAYIRDFLLQYWTLGDSFETAVPWGKVNEVIEQTKASVVRAHAARGVPGHPFVTARVSQIYPTGCCVYFYIGFYYKGVSDPLEVFKYIEHEARLAIVEAGGALSHHHGIGKLRAPYLDRVKSDLALCWGEKVRAALDPEGVFDSKNQRLFDQRSRSNR